MTFVHAACFSYATGEGSVLGTSWLQETSTHVSVCEMPRTMQPVYSLALSNASQRGSSFLLRFEYSTSVSICNMAAKKKPVYQDPSKKNRATTKDKPKSSSPSQAQVNALKGKTNTSKPTAAFTKPGQKATGLGKSNVQGNRFSSTARGTGSETKVGNIVKKTAETIASGTVSLSGAGSVAKAAMNPTKKNIAAAAFAVAPLPLGKIGTFAAKNSYALGRSIIHASPTSGLKKIVPNVSKKDTYGVNVVWGMNPKAKGSAVNTLLSKNYTQNTGSIYVAKVPRGSVKKVDPSTGKLVKSSSKDGIIVSTKPAKVKKEVKVAGKGEGKIIKEVNKGLRKSGSKKLDKSNKITSKVSKIQPDF